jgi:hypothetical protein
MVAMVIITNPFKTSRVTTTGAATDTSTDTATAIDSETATAA